MLDPYTEKPTTCQLVAFKAANVTSTVRPATDRKAPNRWESPDMGSLSLRIKIAAPLILKLYWNVCQRPGYFKAESSGFCLNMQASAFPVPLPAELGGALISAGLVRACPPIRGGLKNKEANRSRFRPAGATCRISTILFDISNV